MVVPFFIPNDTFRTYWIATYFFASLFIVLQAVILVDFAWMWSQAWVEEWEVSDNPVYKYLLIIFTTTFFVLVLVITALLYSFYTPHIQCSFNIFVVTINILLIVVMAVVSVLPQVQEANPRSGLFQAAILSLYITYLVASALASEPVNDSVSCGPAMSQLSSATLLSQISLYCGIAIAFIALGYQAFAAGSSLSILGGAGESDEDVMGAFTYSWFHFVFIIAAMYSKYFYFKSDCCCFDAHNVAMLHVLSMLQML